MALGGRFRGVKEKLPSWAPNVIASYLLAAFAILTIPSPLNHFSTLDPITYQSYIHDYQYMVDLYGYTYYAIRVAWIVPATLFQHLFGDATGYLLVRIFLLGGAASAIAVLVDRLFRRPYGLYGAVWIVFSPTILREMTHNYGDGAAFAYAFVAMACVLPAKEKSWLAHLWGGVFLGLAFNTYPVAAGAAMMTLPAWLYLRRKATLQSNVICALSAAVGFVAIYGVIAAYLWSAFTAAGQTFELVPLRTMKELSSGGAAVWFFSLREIFLGRGDWSRSYPLVVFVALALFLVTRRRGQKQSPEQAREWDGLVAAAILCGAALALYLTLHFKLHSGVITWPWMYDFVLPGCALGSIGLICAVTPPRYDRWAVGAGAALLIAPYLFGALNGGIPYISPTPVLVAGLAIPATILFVRLFKTAPVPLAAAAAAALMVFPLSFYATGAFGSCGYKGETPHGRWVLPRPSYAGCMFRPTGLPMERDLQKGTLALIDDVKRIDPVAAPGIWYANDNGLGNEVGAAYLWEYSRIGSVDAGNPGMPNLDAVARSAINKHTTLVLVGASAQEIEKAKHVLREGGYDLTTVAERRVGGDHFAFNYAILHRDPIDPKLYSTGQAINLAPATAQPGSQIAFGADGLHLRTSGQLWAYAVTLPLTDTVTLDTAFIEIDITVTKGAVGMGILPTDKKDFAGPEMQARAYAKPQKIYLPVSLYDRPVLIVRNVAPGQSDAVIHSIQLVQKKAAAAGS